MARPLLALAAAFAAGCLAGAEAGRWGACLASLLAGALLLLALLAGRPRPAAWALLAAAFGLGAAGAAVERLAYERAPLLAFAEGREDGAGPVAIEGVARGDVQVFPDRVLLVLDLERVAAEPHEQQRGRGRPMAGRIRIDVGGQARVPPIGDRDHLRLWALVRPLGRFRTPGAFDARGAALHDGVHAQGYCKSARLIEVRSRGTGFAAAAGRLRRRARAAFARFVPRGPEEGLVRAMVLGDRTGIDDATADSFRAAGTYHVLALSGAQVALVGGLLVGGLRSLGLGPPAQAVLTVGALSFYALLVGGDVPIARAAVMAAAVLLGRAIELEGDAANLLGLAALVLLAHRPSNVADVGFQLSFGATLGILLLTPPLVAGLPKLPLRTELVVAASVAAQAALLPFLAGHFHRTAPAAIVLNLLAVPLSSAVLLAGLALLGAAWIAPALGPLLGDLAWIAAHALRRSSDLGDWALGLDWRVPAMSLLALAAWVTGLARLRRGRRAAGLGLLVVAAGLPVLEPSAAGDGRLHLSVLDVGQGDALVVRSPRGRTYVVDAGGSPRGRFDTGERLVAPFLWAAGARRIEAIVVTHAHPDHAGGVPFLLRAFPVGAVWEGPAPRQDRSYRSLDEAVARAGVERRTVARAVRGDWDGVEVTVLGPRRGRAPWRIRNADSVVLALRLGEVRLLLTGDIDASAEAELMLEAPGGLSAAVMKVPHHGSRGSSRLDFVAAAAPRVAVVSAGSRNPFGHPHPEVLARYRRAGTLLFRTDRDGTVTVSTDGSRLWVRSVGEALERRVR